MASRGQALKKTEDLNQARQLMLERYNKVRGLTEQLAAPLSDEDQCVQAMADASPVKWHLGHTSWFFETVVLDAFQARYQPFDTKYLYLFNSYYESLGPRQPRPQRGLITRPSVSEVGIYREHVDRLMRSFIAECDDENWPAAKKAIELGLNHEQQHQELILTDVKYMLYQNPFGAVYSPVPIHKKSSGLDAEWLLYEGGVKEMGHTGDSFCYDNETPRHKRYVEPFQLANRLVTCGEYLEFMNDGGYANPSYWLSDGWAKVQETGARAPMYWRQSETADWQVFTLHGFKPLDPNEPVVHVNFFEAMAYASWAGARLPREHEMELALDGLDASAYGGDPATDSTRVLHPQPALSGSKGLQQGYGQAWQWTCSAYDAYPGFVPFEGAVAEYNGKFMVSQLVLRGGSCVTSSGHSRETYRNFFPPGAQWQFTGIRLAKDV